MLETKTPTKNRLQLLAEQMLEAAQANPGRLIRRPLGAGALIGLTETAPSEYELRVARRRVMPSGTEMKTFIRDFGVSIGYIIGPDGDGKLAALGWKGYKVTWSTKQETPTG